MFHAAAKVLVRLRMENTDLNMVVNRPAPPHTPRIDTTVHAALRVVTNELQDPEM